MGRTVTVLVPSKNYSERSARGPHLCLAVLLSTVSNPEAQVHSFLFNHIQFPDFSKSSLCKIVAFPI